MYSACTKVHYITCKYVLCMYYSVLYKVFVCTKHSACTIVYYLRYSAYIVHVLCTCIYKPTHYTKYLPRENIYLTI